MRTLWLAAALACAAIAQPGLPVRGTVINASTGKPVARAAVVLEGVEDSYVVETDGGGRFRADSVAPGRYDARAEREGFVTPAAKRHFRFTVDADREPPPLELRLTPLGIIAGRVVDVDGDPVSKIVVEAQTYAYSEGRRILKTVGRATSDDRGEYRVTGLPPGGYYLYAGEMFSFGRSMMASLQVLGVKPTYDFSAGYFPSAAVPENAVLLELKPGGELRNQTITLKTAQPYTLRVTASGAGGTGSTPAIGVMFLSGRGGMMISTRYGAPLSFPNLKPGAYIVSVDDRPLGLSARHVVNISNADVDITLTPRPQGTFRGVVRGVKPDAARVRVEAEDLMERFEATPAADGAFALEHMRAAAYRLGVITPPGSYLQSVTIGGQPVASPVLDMGAIGDPVEIVLATGGGTLEGTVVDARGAPVEDAVVVAAPSGALSEWHDLVRSAPSGPEGKFLLRDLATGDYQLWAWIAAEEGAPLNAEFRSKFETQASVVRIAPGTRESTKLTAIE